MNILIVEDEPLAAEHLSNIIKNYQGAQIVGICDSVKGTIAWLERHSAPDLMFFDIHLADGLSFEILEKTQCAVPVVFATAYEEYTLKAFKVNSIDYLLKPIVREEVHAAIDRFKAKNSPASIISQDILLQTMQIMQKQYKSRFMVKRGEHLSAIAVEDILYFYSEHKLTWLKTIDNKRYPLDQTLEQLELLVDPRLFFRLNRTFLASFRSIMDVVAYSNSRLKVKLQHEEEGEPVLVSRERVQQFKAWMDN